MHENYCQTSILANYDIAVSFPVNCYLILEKDGLTLIDTGILSNAKGIIALIHKLNLPLKRILLTHAHGDHIGGLVAVKAAFPEALVMIGSREKLLVETKEIYAFEAQKPLKAVIQINFQ